MIQIPLQDIIKKILENTELSEEEINERIKQKLDQLSGLISKEGAAHIIANELGVKVIPQPVAGGKVKIKEILAGMRSIQVFGKVTHFFGMREFKTENRTGKVTNFVIGDETESTRVVCWGEQAEKAANLKEGDIIKLSEGYVKSNNGRNEIHLGDKGALVINPEGITVDVVAKASIQAERKKIEQLAESEDNVEILGTIVQVFDPKFFEVCPECNKRTKQNEEGAYNCPEHGSITPTYSYLLNAYLDDGTGNIQAVFFRNMVESLLGKNPEQVLAMKDNVAAVEDLKTNLLGEIIKVAGRVNKNTMFERLEFVVRSVDTKPDPEKELGRLEEVQ